MYPEMSIVVSLKQKHGFEGQGDADISGYVSVQMLFGSSRNLPLS